MWTFRNRAPGPKQNDAPSFRAKLRVAIMFVVSVITAAALYFAQRNMQADAQRTMRDQFKAAVANLVVVQVGHRAVIAERCGAFANAVRTRAAFEDKDFDKVYLDAAVELHALLKKGEESDAGSLRTTFFRLLDARGATLAPPRDLDGSLYGGALPAAAPTDLRDTPPPSADQSRRRHPSSRSHNVLPPPAPRALLAVPRAPRSSLPPTPRPPAPTVRTAGYGAGTASWQR